MAKPVVHHGHAWCYSAKQMNLEHTSRLSAVHLFDNVSHPFSTQKPLTLDSAWLILKRKEHCTQHNGSRCISQQNFHYLQHGEAGTMLQQGITDDPMKGDTELTFCSACGWRWEHIWQFGGSLGEEECGVGEWWHDDHKESLHVRRHVKELNPVCLTRERESSTVFPSFYEWCLSSSFLRLIISLCFWPYGHSSANEARWIESDTHTHTHTHIDTESERERRNIWVKQLCLGWF